MVLDPKKELIEAYEAFALELDLQKKIELQEAVLDLLSKLPRPDSNDLHIWGLSHYMAP